MKILKLIFFFLITNASFASVILPTIFSDHMVLQQNDEVKIWGWASPNEKVKIEASWTDKVYKVRATNLAKWEINIKTPEAGNAHSITITGYNEIIINDVLIGEVWLCSGQSNMEMSASWGIKDGDEEVEKADYPKIRFFRIEKYSANYPQEHIIGKWEVCTPETMKNNSAVAYFFAQKLQDNLRGTPVGLIISAWGGTPAEIWMPGDVFQYDKVLAEAASKLKPDKWGPVKPSQAFNAMIYPIVGYSMAGVLWYQGETNVGSLVYDKTLSALIKSWRDLWQDNFPFYIVQIAPYDDGYKHFGNAIIRDAQRRVAIKMDNTAMVVISDVSSINNIHPKDKKSVGIRLANLALKKHYQVIHNLVEHPEFENVIYENRKAIIHFKNAKGLYIKGKTSLFEIAGEDNVFYNAKTKLKNQTITVYSNKVKKPNKVRFAWGDAQQSNVFNKANLPASIFTTK